MTAELQNGLAVGGVDDSDPAALFAQRRQARRWALVLGVVAFCVYVGFILATGFRH
ncbi:MAG: hypothetical protein J0M16_07765 [Gammaproteobacteria bacterium]|nr:hypothetical protein [Gammaproteobacteria bacterium]